MNKATIGAFAGMINLSSQGFTQSLRPALEVCSYSSLQKTELFTDEAIQLGCHYVGLDSPTFYIDNSVVIFGNAVLFNLGNLGIDGDGSPLEILAQLYQQKGSRFLNGVDGQFSFALWDRRRSRLILARDSVGAKPLFFSRSTKCLAFANDTRALCKLFPEIRPSSAALRQYLIFNYPFSPGSYYEGIETLPPGRVLILEENRLEAVDYQHSSRTGSYSEVLSDVLSEQMKAGDHIAFHLSGGVDTSLLCHAAKHLQVDSLETITLFYDTSHEDVKYSQIVAEEVKSSHHEIAILPEEYTSRFYHLIQHLHSPIMAIGVPTFWFLAREASKQKIDTLVSGIGGDHPFIGWNRQPKMISPESLFEVCANVSTDTWKRFALPKVCEPVLERLANEFSDIFHKEMKSDQAIEKFFAQHFLQEHLRMAEQTHTSWGITVLNPFLDESLMEIGIDCVKTLRQAKDKKFLRDLLRRYGSKAADRSGKDQMAISLYEFRALFRDEMLREFALDHYRIPGLDYQAISDFALSTEQATKSDLRFLYAVFNVHLWLKSIDKPCPSLLEY
ncbi:asparagine synthase-related protein [Thermoactinomyces sp. DSM 45892]|uniref:asparagine synthetase B family protein n=1 Tax=Thermoactinomyces sp. DSM 45892 TaxID=1882753 RepID=UPI00089D944B|nr:asparagine synthase-related protein [Thermoactinomyces sp. DSM 45892]SDY10636.1 Glutamine amidotransferase domain-containing protein [Thermoactinomyces sp. DSM 45892]